MDALSEFAGLPANRVRDVVGVHARGGRPGGRDSRGPAHDAGRRADAERDAFAVAFWAQPFFPAETRQATLAMILGALEPGGRLLMQEWEAESEDAEFEFVRIGVSAFGRYVVMRKA